MSNQLLPCPFCGTSHLLGFEKCPDHGWTLVKCRKCGGTGPAGRSETELEAAAYWNRRAAQPGAGEPVAVLYKDGTVLTRADCQDEEVFRICCKVETPLYAAPSAPGDDAVKYRLLRLGEAILATDELLLDDCATWQPMSDGPQVGIGWGWHAGLMPVRRIVATVGAQADQERPTT